VRSLILSILILSAFNASSQKIFTEEEFIAVVRKFHPVVKQAAIDVKIAGAQVTATRGIFDPVLRYDNGQKEVDGNLYYDASVAELRVPTWYGIDIYAGEETVKGDKVNPEQTKGTINYYGVSIPVLQNLIIDKRRAILREAKIYQELSEVERNIAVNNLLFTASKAYWDWWEQYNIYQLIEDALKNAEKRLGMVKAAHQFGDRPAIDTLEALTQVQSFQIRQNEVYTNLVKTTLQLNTFLWKDDNSQYDLPLDVVPQPLTADEAVILSELLRLADTHPELIQYDYKLNALEINRKVKLQGLLPKLDLKYNQTGYNIGNVINNPWFTNNYRFGMSFVVPLRISQGRGEYQQAKLKIDHAKLTQVNKQVELYNKVKQYYTEWQQTNQQLRLQQSLLSNTIVLQRGEETKFSNGESSLFLVNSRELKTIETHYKLIELRAKNRKALISLKWSAGTFVN
jgi:outer membrane protein TolC